MDYNNWTEKEYIDYIEKVKTTCSEFLVFLDSIKETYYKNKDVDSEMLRKQNDLLHDIELDDLNYHEIARLGKAIRELRRNRREYKNDYLCHESVKEFAKNPNNINSIKNLINSLTDLAKNVEEDFTYVNNQRYNTRSSIENITTMKLNSNNENDTRSEDIISLNRVLNKYATNVETVCDENDSSRLYIKMQLENTFALKSGKKYLFDLGSNIEKYYKPRQKNISCKVVTSDMCLSDDYGKNTLSGQISIMSDDTLLYVLQIVIREGKNNINPKKKKSKGKKKRR